MISSMSKSSGHHTPNSGVHGGTSGGVQVPVTSIGVNSPIKFNHLTYQHGHSFVKKTFHKPTNCHYCGDLLWGLMGQGYICEGKVLILKFYEPYIKKSVITYWV